MWWHVEKLPRKVKRTLTYALSWVTMGQRHRTPKHVCGSEGPSHWEGFVWFRRFCDERKDLEGEERVSAQGTSREEESKTRTQQIIRTDHSVSAIIVTKLTGILKTVVNCIFTTYLGKRKVSDCFVLHTPMEDQKDTGVVQCIDTKGSASTDTEFVSSIVTCEGTWCTRCDPLTERKGTA